jgi:hypothetical protein
MAEPQVCNTAVIPIRVGRDREHGLGGSLEQQIVEDGLVLVGDGGDLARQRKHDVEIAHW